MRIAIAILAISAALWAQSRITASQLRRGSQDPDQLLAVDVRGQFYALRLGPGVEIVNGEIRVQQAAPVALTRNADGTYQSRGRVVCRNGLVQLPGVDYALDGAVVRPAQPWDAEDVVVGM